MGHKEVSGRMLILSSENRMKRTQGEGRGQELEIVDLLSIIKQGELFFCCCEERKKGKNGDGAN